MSKDTTMNTSTVTAEPTVRHLTCIACPIGCQLEVTYQFAPAASTANQATKATGTSQVQDQIFSTFQVQWNKCPRGEVYAKEEISAPKRMLTTTVRVVGSELAQRVPVRSSQSVPVELIGGLLEQLHRLELVAPLELGQEILVVPIPQDSAGAGLDAAGPAPSQGEQIRILTSHSVKVR